MFLKNEISRGEWYFYNDSIVSNECAFPIAKEVREKNAKYLVLASNNFLSVCEALEKIIEIGKTVKYAKTDQEKEIEKLAIHTINSIK